MASYNYPSRLFDFNGLPPSEGLIAAWNLSTVNDSFGTNHLTNNGVATFVAGKIGNCVNLVAASSQFLSLASNANINFGAGKKAGFYGWFNLASLPGATAYHILGKFEGGGQDSYLIDVSTAAGLNKLRFIVSNDGTAITTLTGTIQHQIGVWYFFACWYDGVKLYMEINADGNIISTPYTADIFSGTSTFKIGSRAAGQFFDGKIDAVRLYKHDNRVLTASERAILYNGGIGREYVTSGNLVNQDQVNAELNQLINLLNGTYTDITPYLKINDTVPALIVNQQGNGPILQCKNNGVVKAEITNTGQLKSNLATGTAPITMAAAATTRIDNLNVDLLDDLNSDAFLQTTSLLELQNGVIFQTTITGGEPSRFTTIDGDTIIGLKVNARVGGSLNSVTTFKIAEFFTGQFIGNIVLSGSNTTAVITGLNKAVQNLYEIQVLSFTGSFGPQDVTVEVISVKPPV